jgi:hypothetical protein
MGTREPFDKVKNRIYKINEIRLSSSDHHLVAHWIDTLSSLTTSRWKTPEV